MWGKYRNDIVAEGQSSSYWRVVPPLDVVVQVLLAVHRVMYHAASQLTRSLKVTGFVKSAFFVRVCSDSPSLVALVGRHICEFLRPSPPNVRNSTLVWCCTDGSKGSCEVMVVGTLMVHGQEHSTVGRNSRRLPSSMVSITQLWPFFICYSQILLSCGVTTAV